MIMKEPNVTYAKAIVRVPTKILNLELFAGSSKSPMHTIESTYKKENKYLVKVNTKRMRVNHYFQYFALLKS